MLKMSKIHIHSVYLNQKEEEKDDNWVDMVPDPQNRQKEKKPFLVVS